MFPCFPVDLDTDSVFPSVETRLTVVRSSCWYLLSIHPVSPIGGDIIVDSVSWSTMDVALSRM